jgi:hypothetical protein
MTEPHPLFAAEQEDLLQGDIEGVVTRYARSFKRSQQRTVGPSELGTACERRLAMSLLGTEPVNDQRDEWTSSVGTAIHAWMEAACLYDNAQRVRAGLPARWLTEQTVTVRTGLDGHTDAYDLLTHTVVDWKFPGVTSIRKYRKAGGPPQEYLWQAHTYGMAWSKLGFPVHKVAIAFMPRSGLIRDTWLWQESYDEAIAEKALARTDSLLVAMNMAEELDGLPFYLNQLPRDTTNCSWCPYWTGGPGPAPDALTGCAGDFEDPEFKDPRHMTVPGIIA